MKNNLKNIMKVRHVLLMFLISLISYTGFANHSDLRQNSAVDDTICPSVNSISMSGVVGVDLMLQKSNFSYVHSVTNSGEIMTIISSKQFNQVNLSNTLVTYVGKDFKPILFKPLDTYKTTLNKKSNLYSKQNYDRICMYWLEQFIRAPRNGLILDFSKCLNITNNYDTRCNCWLAALSRKPRDGLIQN